MIASDMTDPNDANAQIFHPYEQSTPENFVVKPDVTESLHGSMVAVPCDNS